MIYLTESSSDRLKYRPLLIEDIEAWTHYLSDIRNTKHYPKLNITAAERAKLWIESQFDRYRTGNFGMQAVCLKDTGEMIGQCGLLTQEINGIKEIEVGYHFFYEHRGKGYATEAATHMKTLGFKNNFANSIISIIEHSNLPSQAVAKRNGMQEDFETVWKDMTVKIFRTNNV